MIGTSQSRGGGQVEVETESGEAEVVRNSGNDWDGCVENLRSDHEVISHLTRKRQDC